MSPKVASRSAEQEPEKRFEVIKTAGYNVSSVKSSEDGTYLHFTFIFEDCDYCTDPDIVLVVNYFEVFRGGTRLAMPKTICTPDTSSLKPGLRGPRASDQLDMGRTDGP